MFALIVAESSIFVIFVVAYLFYLGKSLTGPMPKDVLEVPIFYTICLLSSSITIHLAVRALRGGKHRKLQDLVVRDDRVGRCFPLRHGARMASADLQDGLTISTNLFGTTYYSLVGLHGFHVIVGLICLSTVMAFALVGDVQEQHTYRVDVLSLYWHFVDVVWIVVFTVVYVIGR